MKCNIIVVVVIIIIIIIIIITIIIAFTLVVKFGHLMAVYWYAGIIIPFLQQASTWAPPVE
jgi:hypothetical protein